MKSIAARGPVEIGRPHRRARTAFARIQTIGEWIGVALFLLAPMLRL